MCPSDAFLYLYGGNKKIEKNCIMKQIAKAMLAGLWDLFRQVEPVDYDTLLPPASQEPQPIKRQINQTIRERSEVERKPELLENIERLKTINPGWSYKLWTDEDIKSYVLEHFGPRMYRYFELINPAYGAVKADLFRYLLMYNEGGVYLDIKSSIDKPLDDFLLPSDELILAYWDETKELKGRRQSPEEPRGILMQWFLIAGPRHPILRELVVQVLRAIDEYNFVRDGAGQWNVFMLSGPQRYEEVIRTHKDKYRSRLRYVYFIEDWGGRYSIYGDSNTHTGLFKVNYKTSKAPIVWNISPWGHRLFSGLMKLINK